MVEAHLGSSFRVEIQGIGGASFSRCHGLGARVEVVRVPEGGASGPRLLPGDIHWEPLVLERGWVEDARLWRWFESREPRGGSIELITPQGEAAGRWSFHRGWPARWMGPSFDAREDQVALEVLEIVHEGLRWETT
jgi:phage tail-like protein